MYVLFHTIPYNSVPLGTILNPFVPYRSVMLRLCDIFSFEGFMFGAHYTCPVAQGVYKAQRG